MCKASKGEDEGQKEGTVHRWEAVFKLTEQCAENMGNKYTLTDSMEVLVAQTVQGLLWEYTAFRGFTWLVGVVHPQE